MWFFRRSARIVLSIGLAILFALLSILRVPQIALSQVSRSLTSPMSIAGKPIENAEAQFRQRFICVTTSAELSVNPNDLTNDEQIRKKIVLPLAEKLEPCIRQNRDRVGTVDIKKLIGVTYTVDRAASLVVVGIGIRESQTIPGQSNPGNPPQGTATGQLGKPTQNPPGGSTSNQQIEAPGKPRPGVPKPSAQVEGVLQIFASTLSNCKIGNYNVSGSFDQSFSQLTLTDAKGAGTCFSTLPAQLFSAPGLADGGGAISFESPIAPENRRIAGTVSRMYGSFTVPIAYLDSPETFGLLTLNSKNTKVSDPAGQQLNNQTTILTQIPAPPDLKISDALPDLLSDERNLPLWIEDQRSGSETQGLTVARNLIQVVYAEDTTIEQLNSGLAAVGGGIISSYEGGTVMTLKIPDTGDLDGLDNARRILRLQPKVITAVPVTRKEVPKPPQPALSLAPAPVQAPPPTPPQLIPLPLQLVGAIDSSGQRPDAPLGQGNVNLFIMDWFSDPVHPDVNLLNPLYQKTYQLPFQPYLGFLDRIASVKHLLKGILSINKVIDSNTQGFLISKNWFCENSGLFCPQRIEGTSATPAKLDTIGHLNVAILNSSKEHQMDAKKEFKEKNHHGYLVSGLMAARNNNQGVVGMYPDANARIFAFNAVGDVTDDRLLYTLEHTQGLHVINFSGGAKLTKELSQDQGVFWATQIRQRKLDKRVVFVQAAGNDSFRANNRIAPAENNGTWSAAGLRDDLSQVTESKRRECGNAAERVWRTVSRGDPCQTGVDQVRVNIPRLSNILIVEALDVTGNYADYSNGVSNPRLAVRAIGHQSTVDPAILSVQACVPPNAPNNRFLGFPHLTSDHGIACIVGGGTSSAAPQVTGLAAWLWSREPNLTASQVTQRIIQNQTPFHVLDQNGRRAFNSNQAPMLSQLTAINVPQTLGVASLSLTGQPTPRPTPSPSPSPTPSPSPSPTPTTSLVVKDINLTVNLQDGTCTPGCSIRDSADIFVDLPNTTVQQFYVVPQGDELAESVGWEFSTQNFASTPERQTFAIPRTRRTFKVARFTVKTKRSGSGAGTVSITVR